MKMKKYRSMTNIAKLSPNVEESEHQIFIDLFIKTLEDYDMCMTID
jgi:hypothetical protein